MVLLTREKLEERLAALHLASLELVSDLSLETLLKRIANLAMQQSGARFAALGVVDNAGDLVQFVPAGMETAEMSKIAHPPVGLGLIGTMLREKKPIRVFEILEDNRSEGFPDGHPMMHSFLSVPILQGERVLGQIYLTDKLDDIGFSDEDEQVVVTLAAYAAVAIINAGQYERLFNRDQELLCRNEDLKLLNNVATTLTSSLETEEILEKTLNLSLEYLGAEVGEIFLREEDEQELFLALHRGDSDEFFSHLDRFKVGQGFVGMAAATNKIMFTHNLAQDLRYLRPAILDAGFKFIVCLPLAFGNKVIGVMAAATRRDRNLDDRELNMLNAIGSWAGTAIENARLSRQSRRLAVLEERERIGMDLHDGIIQSIFGVGLALDYVRMLLEDDTGEARKKIEESIDALNSTIRDIRAYILDLRPRQFHGEDLKQGIQRLIEEFHANCATSITLVGPDDLLVDFPALHATALFHICQESLANIAKHAQAKKADVHIWTTRDRVLLEVSDDGRGFDTRKMIATLGHGLSNMQSRARKVGGDVEITSETDEGTTVLAWVPRRAV